MFRLTALIVSLLTTAAHATPSPALVIGDQLIGATDRAFYVLRTTLDNPPTYYAGERRLSLLTLSVWDGRVLDRCELRHTRYAYPDADTSQPPVISADPADPGCDPARILYEAAAAYITPPMRDPDKIIVTKSGSVHFNDTQILGPDYVLTRATAMLEDERTGSMGTDIAYVLENLGEICTGDKRLFTTTGPGSDWSFARINCWYGSGDESGVSLYLPISRDTLRGAF